MVNAPLPVVKKYNRLHAMDNGQLTMDMSAQRTIDKNATNPDRSCDFHLFVLLAALGGIFQRQVVDRLRRTFPGRKRP